MGQKPMKNPIFDVQSLHKFELPDREHCVYFLIRRGIVVYVGKTANLMQRISSHTQYSLKEFDEVRYTECQSALDAEMCEAANIIHHDPLYNGPSLDLKLSGMRGLEALVRGLKEKPRRKALRASIERFCENDEWLEFRGSIYCKPDAFEKAIARMGE